MLVLRELKPDTLLNSNHSIEAAFYKVRVTMTTDTILMQLHKCSQIYHLCWKLSLAAL